MKRIANFFKSILPILLVLVLQIVITFITGIIYAFTTGSSFSEVIGGIFGTSSYVGYPQLTNFIYGLTALVIFAAWYRSSFIVPFKDKKKADAVRGFSLRVILGVILLGIGLYYVTALVVDVIGFIRPGLIANYNAMISDGGYTDPSFMLIVYVVILAPIVEELVFRGLTYRYARNTFPFWIANIWQSLLFGLLHFNIVQGIYAFVMGLFLGYIVHRGHGVRYSVFVHIIFNVIGLFFYEFVGRTLELHYTISMICGLTITVLALWMYSSYFKQKSE